MVLNGLKINLHFDKDFMKRNNEDSDEGYFLEVDFNVMKNYNEIHNYLPFSLEKIKILKVEKLVTNLHDKKNMLFT